MADDPDNQDPDIMPPAVEEEMPYFFEVVGEAMANWQQVETTMFAATHALLRTDFYGSSLVFFHIRSADSKLQLLDKLVKTRLAQVVVAEKWRPLFKDIAAANGARDRIAHFEIRFGKRPEEEHHWPVLMPHSLDFFTYRTKKEHVNFHTEDHIRSVSDGFRSVSHQIVLFSSAHIPYWRRQLARLPQWLQRRLERLEAAYNGQAPPQPPQQTQPEE